jgi:PKD repeat protein
MALCLALSAQTSVGSVLRQYKVSDGLGGFHGLIDDQDQFGRAVAQIGDIDSDGVADLLVGSHSDDDGGQDRGSVWVLFMASNGRVQSEQKISDLQGNFSGWLSDKDQWGRSLDALGDLDGDGIGDVVVGSAFDDDGGPNRGAVYVLFLKADGTVKSVQKISSTQGGFSGTLGDQVEFGRSVCAIGDVDGDGVVDLCAGSSYDSSAGLLRGAVWVLFLNSDGTVKAHQKINDLEGGLTIALHDADFFGHSCASLGDFDADGTPDLIVGAVFDDDGCLPGYDCNRGAIHLLLLNPDGTIKQQIKISDTTGGFAGGLNDFDHWSTSVGTVRDLDLDGVAELAVGAVLDDDGGDARGATWILFPSADGTIHGYQKISALSGNLSGPIDNGDWFGSSVVRLTDVPYGDLAVGARYDDDGGGNHGALYLLTLEESLPPAPVADFAASPSNGPGPLDVAFTNQSSGQLTSVAWDFGDGAGSASLDPSHVYASAGTYTVSLTATGPGGSDVETKVDLIDVHDPVPPTASFDLAPSIGLAPLAVTFNDTSTGDVVAWLWDFGDGDVSAQQHPAHTFDQAGYYTVTLTASGPAGSDTYVAVDAITALEPPPVAAFAVTPSSGVAPLSVAFDDLSTGAITLHAWDFGDGYSSGDLEPVHVYASAGSYSVTLSVSGPGGSDSLTLSGLVSVAEPPPVAGFSLAPAHGFAPLSVAFTDASGGGPITSRAWDFGDGSTSSEVSPTHVYPEPGTYSVSLALSGPGGSDLFVATDAVQALELPPPGLSDASFEVQTSGQAPGAPWIVLAGAGHVIHPTSVPADGGLPSAGAQWCEVSAAGTDSATPPSNPLGPTSPPGGGAGVCQSFVIDPSASVLEFEAAFLRDGPADQALFNDWMSIDVSDGSTTWNLYYADTFTSAPNVSAANGLALTDTTTARADLRALFPQASATTVFMLTIQVGNGGDAQASSRGYVDRFRLVEGGSVSLFGCGVNPAGSLLLVAGAPSLGHSFTMGVDNPLGTQASGARTFLFFGYDPDPAYPCGTLVAGFGMNGPGANGEVLLDVTTLDTTLTALGPLWQGPGTPAEIALAVPVDPTTLGAKVYLQGLLIDPSAAYGVKFGLTEAAEVTVGP